MKLKSTLFLLAIAIGSQAGAQTWVADSADMGANYATDVYYSMKNGKQKSSSNLDWHIAFQMTTPGQNGNVSIMANHAQAGVEVYSLHMSASSKFTSLVAADTVGLTQNQLFNADTSWGWGAFNVNKGTNIADYGWGVYNTSDHHVYGDTLYLVKVGSDVYKVWPKMYYSNPANQIRYEMRIARFDGTDDTTIKVFRSPDYTNRLFAYYNLNTQTLSDREPGMDSWDVAFTRYITMVAQGPGPLVPYPVMGLLHNEGVEVADVRNVDPDTAKYMNYSYNHEINEIGYDWKTYDQPNMQWVLDNMATFFIKSKNSSEIYQIEFTRFDGTASGKTVFNKRKVADMQTGVEEIAGNVTNFTIVPNPARDNVHVVLDAKDGATARITVMDMTGRVLLNSPAQLNKGLNALGVDVSAYPAGTYIINVAGEGWQVSDRVAVQH